VTTDGALLHTAAQLLDARIGLKPDISFRPRLARALRDVADAMNIEREELVGALATNATLFDAVLNKVTVQESGFFRHPEQFEILARVILPKIQAPFRAWSAASANGQEAYSMAIAMTEAGQPGSVFASDVSPGALMRTATGSYAAREMGGVSEERRRRHFLREGDRWRVRQDIREMVTLQRHNLLDPIPPQVATCHVVMCRNVLIYFKLRHAESFLERLADAMPPTACLFVGAAETLWQMTDRFEPAQIGVSYVYRPIRRGARRSSVAADVTPLQRPSQLNTLHVNPSHVNPSHVNPSHVNPSHVNPAHLNPTPFNPPVSIAKTVAHAHARPTESAKATLVSEPPAPSQSDRALDETGQEDGRLGRQLLASGSLQLAIVAFRRWAFLSPDDPTAYFQLGSALDEAEAHTSALRAYRAAIAALDRCEHERLVEVLHGYNPGELRRLLVDRCLVAESS
jgi:chemotaxis methyl-accepting protein methylase